MGVGKIVFVYRETVRHMKRKEGALKSVFYSVKRHWKLASLTYGLVNERINT